MRTRSIVVVLVVAAACRKSGEHQSQVFICDGVGYSSGVPIKLEPQAVDAIQAELVNKVAGANLVPCTWKQPRPLQLGAHPVAWFCGRLGDTPVEASINRPGMNRCPIELDLRADVSGTAEAITKLEHPVIAFRNTVFAWFKQNLDRWGPKAGCCSTGTAGAVLGDDPGLP